MAGAKKVWHAARGKWRTSIRRGEKKVTEYNGDIHDKIIEHRIIFESERREKLIGDALRKALFNALEKEIKKHGWGKEPTRTIIIRRFRKYIEELVKIREEEFLKKFE